MGGMGPVDEVPVVASGRLRMLGCLGFSCNPTSQLPRILEESCLVFVCLCKAHGKI